METADAVVSIWLASGQEMSSKAALSEALRICDDQLWTATPGEEEALGEIRDMALKVADKMFGRMPTEAVADDMEASKDRLKIAALWGCLQGMSMTLAWMVNTKKDKDAEDMLNRMAALGMGLRFLQYKVSEREQG